MDRTVLLKSQICAKKKINIKSRLLQTCSTNNTHKTTRKRLGSNSSCG